jgi:hypothetical protein
LVGALLALGAATPTLAAIAAVSASTAASVRIRLSPVTSARSR